MSSEGRDKRKRDDDGGSKLPDVHINDSGGEVSMSVEDTNQMRIALGLKPLKVDGPKTDAPKREQKAEEPPASKTVTAEELREKLKQRNDKRRSEQLLSAKALGAKEEQQDDDVYAWVSKLRTQQQQPKGEGSSKDRKSSRRKRRHGSKNDEEQDEEDDEEEEGGYSAKDLAGMKVRHDYGEIDAGETVVLTLADRGILDDKGNLVEGEDDELENVLKAEDKARKKARDAATKKAKPLFEEDGKKRSLLDKYDEEEEEMIRLGDDSLTEARKLQMQEEVRQKLAAGAGQLGAGASGAGTGGTAASDYYTADEMANMFKKKKRKKAKQLRQKPQEDVVMEDTASLIEALEAEADLQAGGKGSDLGKRGSRMTARERAAAEEAAKVAERRERYDRAVEKANWAAMALKNSSQAASTAGDLEDDADKELYESLARARRAAAKEAAARQSQLEEVAQQIATKREEDESKLKEQLSQPGVLEFTETREFVHSIQPLAEEAVPRSKTPMVGMDSVKREKMDVDQEREDGKPDVKVKDEKEGKGSKAGKWVSAESEAERSKGKGKGGGRRDVDSDEDMMDEDGEEKKVPLELQEVGLTGEKVIGRGLAACLGVLKEKGELQQKLEWAGRTNDKKKTQVMGLEDVYSGGMSEDRMNRSIEMALTQRDEYGRILTPKERFRELCYRFHGKAPSKNKQEKKQKQAEEWIARRKAATSEDPGQDVATMRELQAKSGSAFVVLQGKDAAKQGGAAASSSKKPKMVPPSVKTTMKTPVLGGGYTPLTDPQKKVQAMYGISKSGGNPSGSMLPPPPRKPPGAS